MDIQLRVTTTTPETSDWSAKVTFYCATEPMAPAAPAKVFAEQELVQITWEIPTDNGGSSVLGFQLQMKRDTDPDYTLVYDGQEDPTVKTYSTITDEDGNPLVAGSYLFQVRARNIVGFSEYSDPLTLVLAMKTSHTLSVLSGAGISDVEGAVTTSIHVQAVDENGSNRSSGGDTFFLHVE